MRRIFFGKGGRFGLSLLLCLALSARAEQPLGEVLVPAADRSSDAREAALRSGLGEVLVRLTGELQAAENAALAPLLNSPARWAQRFSWQQQMTDEGDSELLLAAQFDSAALVAELERRQVPVWNLRRPAVMLWLVPAAGGKLLARIDDSAESSSELVDALQQRARYRGLPVQLPLMDGQDRQAIRAADVRGHFDRVLLAAASRYPGPFHVAGAVYGGNTLTLRWRLLEQGEVSLSGELSAATEAELMSSLVDQLTEQLAPRYRVGGGMTAAYRVHVDGVASLAGWKTVSGHIQGLVGTSNLQEVSLSPGRLTLDMLFSGDRSTLLALLQLLPGLAPCVASELPGAALSAPALPADSADAETTASPPTLTEVALCWQPVPAR